MSSAAVGHQVAGQVLQVVMDRGSASPGSTLLFYETYRRNLSAEQELSPRYALLAADSVVQPVPEHPRKEHVFCLSNSHGDVYLFQVREAKLG